MIKAFWIVYELILLVGAAMWGLLIVKYGYHFRHYKDNFEALVKKQTERGLNRQEAYNLIYSRKSNALIRLVAHSVIELIYVYILVDLFFTHII